MRDTKYAKLTKKDTNKKTCEKIITMMGICLLAGSFCACGDDTELVLAPEGIVELGSSVEAVSGEYAGTDSIIEATTESEGKQESEEVAGAKEGAQTDSETVPEAIGEHQDSAPSNVSITISAAGDVTLGGYPEQTYDGSLAQTYEEAQSESYFFENVYDIFSEDDMTIVNLEGVLTDATEAREGQIYSIKGRPEYITSLTNGSIEAVSMGNNHRLDSLEQGSADTVELLTEAGIPYAFDENIGIYETQGIRIGFVSVNEFSLGYVVEEWLQEGIAQLKEEQVDLILACCHWGVEREYYPEDYQMSLGRKCIDWGADLVIGHHPHVLQGIEEYQGKYIVYSLGNFCFGANKNPSDKDSMIFQQTFTFVDGVKQEDKDIRIIPCSISSVSHRNDYKPTPATGAEAKRIIDRVNEFSKDFGIVFDENGFIVEK